MFSIFSMFSNFHVLDVFQTYSMVSHLRWQDSTICRALTVTNCTYETETTNHDISSVLQSCDDRKHHSHFLYGNVLSRQAMAVEFSGMQWLTLIRSAQVRFPSHLRISTWPAQSCTLYNTFSLHIVQQYTPYPPYLHSIVHILQHLLITHCTTLSVHLTHLALMALCSASTTWRSLGSSALTLASRAPTDSTPPLLIFLLRPSSFFLSLHSNGLKVNNDINIDNTTGKVGH